jgi:branched-chain amino acid transport system ATP-binding protein
VLLLDEPSSGIAQREAESLAPMLRSVRDSLGASLLVIEHDLTLLRAISDRLVALDLGRIVAMGDPTTVLDNPAVVRSYLGT